MSDHPAYARYWQRKQLIESEPLNFPVRRWWRTDGLSDSEQLIFDAIAGAGSLLDCGAGDLRVMRKLQAAGFAGEYHTQDIGGEYPYTYRDLAEVGRTYGAVLCLDVIEHLDLVAGLTLVDRLVELLAPGGVLVLQTPNARCISSPMSWDMTHLHVYSVVDLWAHLTTLGLHTDGYRVALGARPGGVGGRLRFLASAFVITRLLGCDYAENILLVARRPAEGGRGPQAPPLESAAGPAWRA